MTNFRAALAGLLLAFVTFANAGPDGGEGKKGVINDKAALCTLL